jgi:hypothetical protein
MGSSFIQSALPLASYLGLAGCSSIAALPARDGIIFDIARSEPARVTQAGANEENGETVIYGEAALPMTVRPGLFFGGVDATIDAPGQKPILFHRIKVIPRPRPRVMGGEAFFVIHTGQLLPPGAVVHLVYRNG